MDECVDAADRQNADLRCAGARQRMLLPAGTTGYKDQIHSMQRYTGLRRTMRTYADCYDRTRTWYGTLSFGQNIADGLQHRDLFCAYLWQMASFGCCNGSRRLFIAADEK